MMIMAIEAANQVSQKDRPIKAFYIKEALLSSPIVLKSNSEGGDSIETVTHLRPLRKPYEKSSTWSEVWISTAHNGSWTECFHATIQTQYFEQRTQVDGGLEQELIQQEALEAYDAAVEACTTANSSDEFYEYCKKRGLAYGETFRLLEDIHWDGKDVAIGRVNVSRPSSKYQGLVHPAIIDAACQIFWVAPSSGLAASMPTEVPHRVYDAYLSASKWKYPDTSHVRILTTSRYKAVGRGVQGSLSMFADDGSLLCKVGKMEMDPIADDDLTEAVDKKLLYGIDWKPSLSTMLPSELERFCKADDFPLDDRDMTTYCQRLESAIRHSIQTTLASLSEHDRRAAPAYLKQYIQWMEQQQAQDSFQLTEELDEATFENLLSELEAMKPSWRMFAAVARNLSSILSGSTDPLSLVFSTNLAEEFYSDIFANICDSPKFRTFIDLAAHQQPDLKILEVGAGTGGMTTHVLSALLQHETHTGGTAFSAYDYTDVSHAFFENAQAKFHKFASRMTFRAVDLERDLISQGIKSEGYDMIIAGGVLHATATLSSTLQNVRRALKPGGKLVFFEIVKPGVLALNFGFGILPGWWGSSEEWRAHAQGVDEPKWDALLRQTGFSGNDLVLKDFNSEVCHNFSVIVTTAVSEVKRLEESHSVVMVVDHESTAQSQLAEVLRIQLLEADGNVRVEMVAWSEIATRTIDPKDIFILLVEWDNPILDTLTELKFQVLKQFILKVKSLLWVTSTQQESESYPYFGMTNGFLRTMRGESLNKRIITLALEGLTEEIPTAAKHIKTVFNEAFHQSSSEVEYTVRDGHLQIGRLIEENSINESMLSGIQSRTKLEPWGQGPPLVFNVKHRGTLDSLEFIEDPRYQHDVELDDHEVEVEAKTWGVNFRDIFIALGRLEENDFGFDAAGIVRRAGPRCRVKPGDRVLVAVIGSMRSVVRCQELEIIRIPDKLNFADAAAICAPGVTAYHSLVDTARLQKGERILIHSASGATGQIALQISQWIGAEVFATVGTDEKKKFLQDTYSIPADHIFYSRNTSFAHGVMRMTKGEGVHVVLNSLSGDALRVSWDCVAPYGRFIEIGKVDIKSNSGLPMLGFSKNVTFAAVDLHHVSETRKDITQHLLQSTMKLLDSGAIRPPQPVHVFPVSKIEEGFRFFQTGKNTGRIVISMDEADVVPVSSLTY
jgi:NADPH:quinone reductase-like Zn-dependent oxidoreductase/SAM-dependent methyltransferase